MVGALIDVMSPLSSMYLPRHAKGTYVSSLGSKEVSRYNEPPTEEDESDPVNRRIRFRPPQTSSKGALRSLARFLSFQ